MFDHLVTNCKSHKHNCQLTTTPAKRCTTDSLDKILRYTIQNILDSIILPQVERRLASTLEMFWQSVHHLEISECQEIYINDL